MTSEERYNNIKKSSVVVDSTIPTTSLPIPTQGNYAEGYIMRYFLQRRDTPGSPIYEVDQRQYPKFNFKPYYKGIIIKWRIIGNLNDGATSITDGSVIKHPSITTSNRLAIQEAAKEMPDIRMHLVNLQQFWKPL